MKRVGGMRYSSIKHVSMVSPPWIPLQYGQYQICGMEIITLVPRRSVSACVVLSCFRRSYIMWLLHHKWVYEIRYNEKKMPNKRLKSYRPLTHPLHPSMNEGTSDLITIQPRKRKLSTKVLENGDLPKRPRKSNADKPSVQLGQCALTCCHFYSRYTEGLPSIIRPSHGTRAI